MATTINAGRVAMVPKGAWSNATEYSRLDVVTYQGSSYVSKTDENEGNNPSSATTYWQLLASGVDPSNYYTGSEVDTLLAGKQATLVSGTNIKTVNNESLLGSGNISTKEILTLSNDLPSVGTAVNSDDYTLIETAATNGMLVQHSGVVYYLYSSIIGTPPNGYTAIWAIKFNAPTDVMNIGFSMVGYAIRTSDHVVTKIEKFNANAKQDALVSGTNIKTINNTSLLGSGDVKTLPAFTNTIPQTGLLPNVVYDYGTTDTVSITLASGEANVANVWMFTFTAQSASCSVTLPSGVTLANEYAWDMAAGRRFEVTIMDNVAAVIYSDPASNS